MSERSNGALQAGRVLKAHELGTAVAAKVPTAAASRRALAAGSILRREVLAAQRQAEALIAAAQEQAQSLLTAAQRETQALRLSAELEARAEAAAQVAARALALTALEAKSLERQLDNSVAWARLLAERLLGTALQERPERILELARQVLRELHGAQSLTLHAHPEDASVLQHLRCELDIPDACLTVIADETLQRGDLSVVSEFGTVDAPLAVQLGRLAEKLREFLVQTR